MRTLLTTPLLLALLACGGADDPGGARSGEAAPGGTTGGETWTAGTVDPGQEGQIPPRGFAWVVFGADTVLAEVARTPEERQRGLMFREELPAGTGMLFVFERPEPRSFWMQNTYIPLDIAYLDAGQRIVNIVAMEPLSTDFYESDGPALFALEVPQGWFAGKGIAAGDQARIIFGAP